MEEIKLANINSIYDYELHDESVIVRHFESTNDNFLYIKNKHGNIIGIYNLDDFCKNDKVLIEKNIQTINESIAEEYKLLNKIKNLSKEELLYIKNTIIERLSEDNIVCCCQHIQVAKFILNIIFENKASNIKIYNSILQLKENENVIFLSFKMIKLYRKFHYKNIKKFVILYNLVKECINKSFYYENYPNLINYLDTMNIYFFYGIIPDETDLNNLSERSKKRICGLENINYKLYSEILGGKNSKDYIASIQQNSLSQIISNGIHNILVDCNSEYYNVIGGMRVTSYQPKEYNNIIYIFGPCIVRGVLVEDSNTIPSIVQKFLNYSSIPYLVMNCGLGGGTDLYNTYRYILSLPLKPGDIVILIEEGNFIEDNDIKNNIFKLAECFNNTYIDKEWFLDRPAHCNAIANEIIATQIAIKIKSIAHKNKNSIIPDTTLRLNNKFYPNSNEISAYVRMLKEKKFTIINNNSIIGAIAMNCNPMTKGHKYLIEQSLKIVDFLYIFILSDDKFELSFEFRKNILEHEIKNLKNVKVIESGCVMATTIIFPEYFNKELKNNVCIDASKDILTFCRYVAPTLNITKRFVGTENRDFITRQYNNQLKIILSLYGIELHEIPRLENNLGSVSAFKTRQFIKQGDWSNVSEMVTPYVLEKLKQKYINNKI